ncbi:hypothetical protein PRZ48_013751 [Zasmidium cellare]|uniref:Uncharacterized protein n=1 Tax=Zasmidium cellare TaxID=395010 RepID=A0ABR0E1Z2_ZASCE|nr:hypothetical protein PRZ48_013751 [Zasmidium cellare]
MDDQYSRSESEDGFEAEKTPMIGSAGKRSKWRNQRPSWTFLVVAAIIVLLLTANAILMSLWLWGPQDLDSICVKHTSAVWSPVPEDIHLTYQTVRFDGNPFVQSRYVQDAGPEVDQAWADLGLDLKYTSLVPEERGLVAGIDPSSIKVNASLGGGYITTNMIRQTLPWNVDYYKSRKVGPWEKIDWIARAHIDHCLDMVRQQIQCDSDVGMLAARWVKEEGEAVNFIPEFSTTHMCRNYDDVLEVSRHGDVKQLEYVLTPAIRDSDVVLTDPRDIDR